MPFLTDDSLISLRYAHRLINGFGLTWTEGIRVEGYSNLLWILLVAFLGKIGVDLIVASRILGLLFTLAIIPIAINYVVKRYEKPFIILVFVLLFYSFSGIMLIWSIGGLEQSLFGFLALLSIVKYLDYYDFKSKKSIWISSLAMGLLCITRPDGILIPFSVILFHLWSNRSNYKQSSKVIFKLAILPLIFFFGQIIFRLYYYGELIPNTALVKVSPSLHHLWEGIHYNLRFIKANLSFAILSLVAFYLLIKSKNKRYLLYPIILIIWLSYISFIGGDIFPAFRHHYITFVVLMLVIIDGANHAINSNIIKKWQQYISTITLILMFSFFILQQYSEVYYTTAKKELWEWQLKSLSEKMKLAFAEKKPLIAVDAAGSLPYWTEFPAIDMLGLNDYYIPRNKPVNMGNGQLGHELGDANYILNRNPDIILFHIGLKTPVHYADTLLYRNERFRNQFTPVNIKVDGNYPYNGVLWLNKQSKKIGIIATKSEIRIPAYFFEAESKLYSEFGKGKLSLVMYPNQKAIFTYNHNLDIKNIIIDQKLIGIEYSNTNDKSTTTITLTNKSNSKILTGEVILKLNTFR